MSATSVFVRAAVSVVLLGSCAGSGGTSDTTVAPATTAAANTTSTPVAGPTRISVTVGEDSGEDRIESVRLGASVEVTLVNPGAEDSFHLHGYDIEIEDVAAGSPATISFVASEPGSFEIESHDTNQVYIVIEVG